MNILRVIASVRPEGGGPIQGLQLSALRHAASGHSTEIASLDDPQVAHVRAFPLPVHGLGPGRWGYGYVPGFDRWIAENARRFDVAVLHGLWNYSSFGAWRALRRARLPYVIYAHGMLDPWFNSVQPIKRWAKQAYWLVAEGRVLADASFVLFTTEEEQARARASFVGYRYRGRVVAYGAGDPPAAADADEAEFRALVPALGNRTYLLFLSRIHPKKGADLLIEAFAGVAPENPELDLVLAGPDQIGLAQELCSRAEALGMGGRVHFPGMLEGAAKWGAFRGAEAFVLPSHQENFGIVVAEAMASGTPVLISDKVNIWREVAAAGAGLVDEDSAEGTSRLLQRFLGLAQQQRQAMSGAARSAYERYFSADNAAGDLITVLEDVAREGAR